MKSHEFEIIDLDSVQNEADLNNYDSYDESYSNNTVLVGESNGKHSFKSNVIKIILIVLCVYMVFLIIGTSLTGFYVNEEGKKQVIFVNYDYLKDMEDYKTYKKQISNIREIMVDITILDIKVANDEIPYIQAANDYNSILNSKIDVLIPKIEVANVEESNAMIKNSISSLLSADMAVYLQNISNGLASNDANKVNEALEWRKGMFNQYENIIQQMKNLSENLKQTGDDFFEWNLNQSVIDKEPELEKFIEGE